MKCKPPFNAKFCVGLSMCRIMVVYTSHTTQQPNKQTHNTFNNRIFWANPFHTYILVYSGLAHFIRFIFWVTLIGALARFRSSLSERSAIHPGPDYPMGTVGTVPRAYEDSNSALDPSSASQNRSGSFNALSIDPCDKSDPSSQNNYLSMNTVLLPWMLKINEPDY